MSRVIINLTTSNGLRPFFIKVTRAIRLICELLNRLII